MSLKSTPMALIRVRKFDSWLGEHGMPPSQKAPFTSGNRVLHLSAAEQNAHAEEIKSFIDGLKVSLVICSGFMPVFLH